MSPVDVDIALENAHRAVRLYEAALDLLDIGKALGVSPGSPDMFTNPSERVYDRRTGPSSTNVVATVEKDTDKTVTNLPQFSKYCDTGANSNKTVSSQVTCCTSNSIHVVKKQAVQRSCAGKASGCGQSSRMSAKNGVRAAGLKRPPPGSKPLHNISNLRR